MKITEDVRKYAAEQGIAEEEALKKRVEAKSNEFMVKGAEVTGKSWTTSKTSYPTSRKPSVSFRLMNSAQLQ
jgi:hypothetical protein